MQTRRQYRWFWWIFWTYFNVINTFYTTILTYVKIGIDDDGLDLRQQHLRDLLTGGDIPRSALSGRPEHQITRGRCCRNALPTVINAIKCWCLMSSLWNNLISLLWFSIVFQTEEIVYIWDVTKGHIAPELIFWDPGHTMDRIYLSSTQRHIKVTLYHSSYFGIEWHIRCFVVQKSSRQRATLAKLIYVYVIYNLNSTGLDCNYVASIPCKIVTLSRKKQRISDRRRLDIYPNLLYRIDIKKTSF